MKKFEAVDKVSMEAVELSWGLHGDNGLKNPTSGYQKIPGLSRKLLILLVIDSICSAALSAMVRTECNQHPAFMRVSAACGAFLGPGVGNKESIALYRR
ncbi:MAG: hypothetical protein WA968_04000 [Castellaniella sp.]